MIVGLTGSIATGKSTVSKILTSLGAVIIDADRIVRHVQAPGERAWQGIVEAFGKEILLDSGELDRAKLGNLVFTNEENRRRLNEIVHPIVRDERDRLTQEAREENPEAIVIWDIPLLIETGIYREVDKVIVVYVDEETQLKRLLGRDELTEEQAKSRIAAQMSIETKKEYADFLLDNRGTLEDLEEQVREVWAQLQSLQEEQTQERQQEPQK